MQLYLIIGILVLLAACSPQGPDVREHGSFLYMAFQPYASANPHFFGTSFSAQIDAFDADGDCRIVTEPFTLDLGPDECDRIVVELKSDARIEPNGSVSAYRSYSFETEQDAESFVRSLTRAVERLHEEKVELSPASVYADSLYRTFEDVRVFRIVDFEDETALYRFILLSRYENIVILHVVATNDNRIVVAHWISRTPIENP